VLAELDRIEGEDEPPAVVPRSWLDTRLLGEARVEGRFVDVGDTTSLATLRTALAASAIRHGLDEIDAATIRLRAPRASRSQASAIGRDSATTSSTGRSSSPRLTQGAHSFRQRTRRSKRTTLTCKRRLACST
jgi:hypothetical protein